MCCLISLGMLMRWSNTCSWSVVPLKVHGECWIRPVCYWERLLSRWGNKSPLLSKHLNWSRFVPRVIIISSTELAWGFQLNLKTDKQLLKTKNLNFCIKLSLTVNKQQQFVVSFSHKLLCNAARNLCSLTAIYKYTKYLIILGKLTKTNYVFGFIMI